MTEENACDAHIRSAQADGQPIRPCQYSATALSITPNHINILFTASPALSILVTQKVVCLPAR
jgi:hypothetical protein